MMRLCVIALGLLWATTSLAQEVSDCDWRSSVRGLPEPWKENTRTFANGDVRIALIDTGEPAAAAMYLLVLSPPYDELGERQCKLIGPGGDLGFGVIFFNQIDARYDPATGLRFDFPALLIEGNGSAIPAMVSATLNQATGEIGVLMDVGTE